MTHGRRTFLLGILILLTVADAVKGESLEITVDEGLRLAFSKNEILQVARGALDRAGYAVRQARSDGLPQITVGADFDRNFLLPSSILDTDAGPQRVTFGTKNNLNSNITVRQTLFAGGRIASATSQAKHFRNLTRETLRETRQNIHAEVETAFYDLLLARELVRVSHLALERARRNLKQTQLLRQAGRASRFDLLRAEVQVLQLSPDSIRAHKDFQIADLTFKNTIGLQPEQEIDPVGGFRSESAIDVTVLNALVETGITRRPDFLQFQHRISTRRQAIRVRQAGYLPTVDVLAQGRMQVQTNDLASVTRDDLRRSWFAGVRLSFPLFDGLETASAVAQARIDLRQTELLNQNLLRAIRVDIHRAWLTYKEAGDRQAAQTRARELTGEGLRMAEAQYAEGLVTQLEITDAQLSLLRAETEVARARRDRAVAIVELERAVGQLGEEEERIDD